MQVMMPSVSLPSIINTNTGKVTSTSPPEPQLLELGPDFTVYIGAERDARFIYKEIFEDNCYDIAPLPSNPCMFVPRQEQECHY